MKKFPQHLFEHLQFYVYLYIDPRDNSIFYVGKGRGNRAFAHLDEVTDEEGEQETEKVKRIRAIRAVKKEPRIELLAHGLSKEIAFKIEASIIDLLWEDETKRKSLTNLIKGLGSKAMGRMSVEQLLSQYDAPRADISEPAILIRVNQLFRYTLTPKSP